MKTVAQPSQSTGNKPERNFSLGSFFKFENVEVPRLEFFEWSWIVAFRKFCYGIGNLALSLSQDSWQYFINKTGVLWDSYGSLFPVVQYYCWGKILQRMSVIDTYHWKYLMSKKFNVKFSTLLSKPNVKN